MQHKNTDPGRLYMVALGCPKNLVDSELLAGNLLTHGMTLEFEPENADLYLINTCAFLPEARAEAFAEIEEAITWKRDRAGRRIAVAGCLTEYDKDRTLRTKYPEVDLWLGVDDVGRAAELLDGRKNDIPHWSYLHDEHTPRLQLTLPHLAYLKIADGCNNRCTYCAIPNLRGNLRSRPQASVAAEAKQLLANGVKELILVAQDVTAYGMDRKDGSSLASLLRELDRFDGNYWIRLLYTHPAHYSDELIAAIAAAKHVVPYLDIPLQHVSERIVKAMNRHTTAEATLKLLKKLRASIPQLVLRTTFITGFPGESEAEFSELENFCRDFKFDRMGVFAYSAEPGTPAAKLPEQIPTETAEERAAALMKKQIARMKRANRAKIGQRLTVIADSVDTGLALCRSMADSPDIDDHVLIAQPPRSLRAGKFAEVEITGVHGCDLVGQVIAGTKKRK